MKKQELIKQWKEKFNLDSKTVNQVLEFVFNLNKEKVFLLEWIDEIYLGQIIFIFEKLNSGYPLAYIIKNVNFMGMDFYVDENVLIPRDDTEILVKVVIEYINNCHCDSNEAIQEIRNNIANGLLQTSQWQIENRVLLDIWTGSWIIPISLAKNVDFKEIYAIDISESAVEIAKENVFRHSLEEKIKVINIDFKELDYLIFKWENLIITANLPYIKEGDYENMDLSVYKFEPKTALYWWKFTWFELYEELIELLIEKRKLFKSLLLFIEIWFDQDEVSKDFLSKKWLKFEIFKDTNNIQRVIKVNM